MDITQGKAAIGNATDKAVHGASHMVDNAKYGIERAGDEVNSFVHKRPIETALLSAAAACLLTGLVFWLTRPD